MSLYWFLLLLQLHSLVWLTSSLSPFPPPPSSSAIARLHCKDHCGKVKIPYPFGIGANCYQNPWYEIVCNSSSDPPKALLRHYNLEVTKITWPAFNQDMTERPVDYQTLTVHAPIRNICASQGVVSSSDFRGSPYIFSGMFNVFKVEGCSGTVLLKNRSGQAMAGCASVCTNSQVAMTKAANCYGAGCCQSSVAYDYAFDYYEIGLDHVSPTRSTTCNLVAALVDSESADKMAGRLSHLRTAPAVLQWRATYLTANDTRDSDSFSCADYAGLNLQTCQCTVSYRGNPYFPNGCQGN